MFLKVSLLSLLQAIGRLRIAPADTPIMMSGLYSKSSNNP